MSKITINALSDNQGTGAITFPKGVALAADKTLTASNVNVTGVATATSFVGNGNALTNLPGVSLAKGIALSFIA